MSESEKLKGFGGWLIPLAITIILITAYYLYVFTSTTFTLLSPGVWETFTVPGNAAYHPLVGTVLIVELLANALLFSGWCYTLYVFFSKQQSFPRVLTTLLVSSLIYVIVDTQPIRWILPDAAVLNMSIISEIIRYTILILVLLPYVRRSKRVLNTFTHDKNRT